MLSLLGQPPSTYALKKGSTNPIDLLTLILSHSFLHFFVIFLKLFEKITLYFSLDGFSPINANTFILGDILEELCTLAPFSLISGCPQSRQWETSLPLDIVDSPMINYNMFSH